MQWLERRLGIISQSHFDSLLEEERHLQRQREDALAGKKGVPEK